MGESRPRSISILSQSNSRICSFLVLVRLLPIYYNRAAVHYLALINRAGGLYGRILTEVVSTDRTQWGLYTRPRSRFSHTDRLSSVNKMFIIWQTQEQFNLFHELVSTNWHFACERQWAELNSFKVCSSSLLFFLISSLALTGVYIFRWKLSIILHFSFQLFHSKTLPV